ncbi:tripartite tricarboxylate transporter substrate binding protein [Amycolatopsis sp. DSM 110486]|uniref:Bug family tripartite tricarboxylate transporter substrate binding protein n=1 Tax=Amycolatopsis sp. DSM 110486 TaxID=2865832 RepID=UPI001C6984CE|nr:tripartite tricarboxylate transporter substrate binding protein [Amycolatopsis sp. DSM 110486]QYN21612.1 tripartite tricarboxylate transporter substrate binding protein [Amycolatopsis sp. DSM 110486]
MRTSLRLGACLAAMTLILSGCGIAQRHSANGVPSRTEVVVHTGPGGGSDVFARQVVKMLQDDKLIDANWPVRNETAGSGIGAMSYLKGRRGREDTIAAITPTWIVTPLTLDGAAVSVSDVQPIAGLLVEPQVMAVRADSKYRTAADFIADARAHPDGLVQVGGSVTATDSLTGQALQSRTKTKWSFLTFSDSGQRIASLLRGDAQMMIGSTGDFSEQVRAGAIRVIGAVGDKRLAALPNVPTLAEEGVPSEGLPEEFRGFMGPPDMPAQTVAYYQEQLRKLSTRPDWKKYAEADGDVTKFLDANQFRTYLAQQQASLKKLVDQLGLASR